MSKNTLFNYFLKSPTTTPTENKFPRSPLASDNGLFITPVKKLNKTKCIKSKNENKSSEKRKSRVSEKQTVDNEESYEESPPHKKRKRILEEIESEEDSGDEYIPENGGIPSDDDISTREPSSEKDESFIIDEDDDLSSKSAKKNGQRKKNDKLNVSSKHDKSRNSFPITVSAKENIGSADDSWPHLKLDFLNPSNIRDGNGRKLEDPNYDHKTLYVPEDFKKSLTPAVRQWWEMKSKHYDVVLFFKVGKFYELYHMDAVLAANELNLTFMKGEFAHVGFPEIAYGRFSSTLVEKGYKVARVEQTETPDMMLERYKNTHKATKFDKVVRREICQITSRGTRIFSILDGECKEAESNFLLAICEKGVDNGNSCYGVCFIDTTIAEFHIGQFLDDRHSSRLRTLIAHYPPVQILYEKNQVSQSTMLLFNTVLSGVAKDQLHPETEFWSSCKTLVSLKEGGYFSDDVFPETLNDYISQDGYSNMMVSDDCELGVRALGAVIWYLKRCLIDHQIISMGKFSIYKPVDLWDDEPATSDISSSDSSIKLPNHMILDATTLKNLNILENSIGGLEGTLFQKLDNCCTPFGKRLLHHWICNPLLGIENIQSRQEAITYLKECHILKEVRSTLSQLPDLERLLSRVYAQGSNGLEPTHPDTRAIMFEEKTYSKKKIVDFISILNGFKLAVEIIRMLRDSDAKDKSKIIARCCYYENEEPSGLFPNLTQHLDYFQNAFDHNEAQKEGRILPKEGMDNEYDEAVGNLKTIEKELDVYLKAQCQRFHCKVTYYGSDKKRFQLEIPDNAVKWAGSGYELQSQRKGFRRYTTAKTKELLDQIIGAEEQKRNVLKNLRQRIFSRFSERSLEWNKAIQCLSILDVLISFAEYCRSEENVTCIPEFIQISDITQPFIKLNEGRYPCVTGDDVFIPNDTFIGSETGMEQPNLVLVTGPNMGGKSTLMRQLGLIVIMAHMGCHVPAAQLKMSIVDRIFTRIGANDDIMAGESTFYVELCETSSILQHVTKHSLVLIDELGRGTSTYDGTAIAASVVNELCSKSCRTLFSTHYHSLVEDFQNNPKVKLGHMSCMVEDSDCNSEETVIFLYKFVSGACPKSYGFNAARLAGMPQHIIKLARDRAKQFEMRVNKRNYFKNMFHNGSKVREFIARL